MFSIINKLPRRAASSLFGAKNRSQNTRAASQISDKTTIDQNEVNFFGDISKHWWDELGPMKPLHAMNKIRVQFIRSGLINTKSIVEESTFQNPAYLKGFSIADIGCGGGILSLTLARLGCNVVGIEPSQELVSVAEKAKEKFKPIGDANFFAVSVEEYAKSNANFFDAVVCSEVIEHVTMKEEFIKSCIEILKPGGSIFFTTPNKTMPSRIFNIFVAETLQILPAGSHQYDKFIPPDELSQILNKFGCETKMTNGFMYNPLENSFCWTSSTAMHYALHAVKI